MATSRRQQAVTAVLGATEIGTMITMATVMAVYVGRRGSPFAVGMVVTAYFLGMILFAPVWGAIADVTGRRRAVLAATAGLAALAILPLSVVRGAWGQIALRGVFAVFAVGIAPVMFTIMSERGGVEGRGRSIGWFNSARSAGFMGARLLGGALLVALSQSGAYLAIAGAGVVCFFAALAIDDPTPDPDRGLSLPELAREVRGRLFPADGREHLRTRGLRWLYVALAARNAAWLGVSSLLPVYLIVEVGASELGMGVLLALAPAIEIAGMYLFGRASDTWGRKPLIVLGMVGNAVALLAFAAASLPASPLAGQAVAAGGLVLKGVVFSAMMAGALAFIGDVTPVTRESELMGLRSTAKGVGGVLGPALVGGLATVASYEAAFVAASLVAGAAAAVVWFGIAESHPDRVGGAIGGG